MEKIQAIRGAITVKENSVNAIKEATSRLIKEIIDQNNLVIDEIVNISFTMTDDLTVANPATALRETLNLTTVPMLCSQEMKIDGGMPFCIRTMIQTYTPLTRQEIKHIYLEEAANLRPDLGDVPGQQKLNF